jgi:hypothetical protein
VRRFITGSTQTDDRYFVERRQPVAVGSLIRRATMAPWQKHMQLRKSCFPGVLARSVSAQVQQGYVTVQGCHAMSLQWSLFPMAFSSVRGAAEYFHGVFDC